jgi:hypothetical protein
MSSSSPLSVPKSRLNFGMDHILGNSSAIDKVCSVKMEESPSLSRSPSPAPLAPSPMGGSSVTSRSSCGSPLESHLSPVTTPISSVSSSTAEPPSLSPAAAYNFTHAWAMAAAANAANANAAAQHQMLLQRLGGAPTPNIFGKDT